MSFPTWTKFIPPDPNTGRDFLGIQNVGNRVMNDLLPGLTGATIHPRHYSFVCWVLSRTDDWGKCSSYKQQLEFLYRYENIMLIASEQHEHRYSMAQARPGGNAIRRLLRKDSVRFGLDRASVGRNPSIFDVVNYGPSVNELGLIRRKVDGVLIPSPNRGKVLADHYEASIGPGRDLLFELRDAKVLAKKDAAKLADWMCPCALSRFTAERRALQNLLFGEMADQSPDDVQRRKSLQAILALTEQMPQDEDPSWSLPTAVYYLQAGKKALSVPPSLDSTFHGWALFQARSFVQYAVTGLWSAFLSELNSAPRKELEIGEVVARWMSAIGSSSLLSELLPGMKASDPSVREILRSLEATGQVKPTSGVARNLGGALKKGPAKGNKVSEYELAERLDEEYDADRIYALALVSLLLLFSSLQRWKGVEAAEWDFGWAVDEGGIQRLSIRSLCDDLAEREELRLSQFFAWALRRYVVDQHFYFATEKLLGGRNTFHFERGDSGFHLVEPDEGGWIGANYIPAALRLMHALHLLSWNEETGGFSITKEGSNYLQASLQADGSGS